MSTIEFLSNDPEIFKDITIAVKGSDLIRIISHFMEVERKVKPAPEKKEGVITAEEFMKMFDISRVTLWDWDNKGITNPVYVGKRKYYRQSDIDKMLAGG